MDLLNPAAGGLSKAKLALATAKPADVLAGKTFYAGDKIKKTGSYSAGISGSFSIGSNQSSATFDIGFVPNAAYVKIHSYGRDAEFFGIAGTNYKVSGSLNQFNSVVNGSASISGSTLKISNLSYDSYTVIYSFRK